MITKEFQNELEKRKYRIVTFLSTLFFITGIFGSTAFLLTIFRDPTRLHVPERLISLGLTLLITILFGYIRFVHVKKDYKIAFRIVLTLFSIAAINQSLSVGTLTPITYIIIFLMLLSTSIVAGVKKAVLYSAILIPTILLISLLQELQVITYMVSNDLPLANTIIFMLLVGVGTYIVKIGYEQIEHSYQKAYDYAKELEELNEGLDKQVKLRTKQLVESLEMQAESVHSAAVMGSITKPMLHDLATPLSSLKGAFSILENGKNNLEATEVFDVSKEALSQIERIVQDARNLMDNKNLLVEFSPFEVISVAIFVSKHQLQRDNIKVKLNINPQIKLVGVVAVFERIVVNIIINAIEELLQSSGKREINIDGAIYGNYFVLTIKDSGRGVKKENLEKIFEPDFTLKSKRNLGFGLPFVKRSIEKKFGGEIYVESKEGKYTKFILKFDRKFNVLNSKADPSTQEKTNIT